MDKDTQSRFTHLLQPIRDLTKNWDIDVASQLEEYLAEVSDQISHTTKIKVDVRSETGFPVISVWY